MRLLKYELIKSCSNRLLLFLSIFLIFGNLYLYYDGAVTYDYRKGYVPVTERQVFDDLQDMTEVEKGVFLETYLEALEAEPELLQLRYTDDVYMERQLISAILEEVATAAGYQDYLADISNQSVRISGSSLFAEVDDFSYRNAIKTAQAYTHLEGLTVPSDISTGISSALSQSYSDVFLMLFAWMMAMILIMPERDKGLDTLTRPTAKGYQPLIRAKLLAGLLLTVLMVLLLYGGNLIGAHVLFGTGDLSRPIQSVYGFTGAVLPVSVGGYIGIYLLTKVIAAFVVFLIALYFCIRSVQIVQVCGYLGILTGLSLAAYQWIGPASVWGILHTVNLVTFVRVTDIYQMYRTLNIAGYPVNALPVIWGCFLVLGAVMLRGIVRTYCRPAHMARWVFPGRWHLPARERLSVSLTAEELYKQLIANKTWIILAVIVLFQGYDAIHTVYPQSMDERYYQQYIDRLEGELTPEKEEYLEEERQRFETAAAALEELGTRFAAGELTEYDYEMLARPYASILSRQQVFDAVLEQYEHIVAGADYETKPQFVYKTGFGMLTAAEGYEHDTGLAIRLHIFLIAALCLVFSSDYASNEIGLIRTAKRGREQLFWRRYLIGTAFMSFIFVLVYAADVIVILKQYGTNGLLAPANSLVHIAIGDSRMTILVYLLLMYLLRYIAALLIMAIIFLISLLTRNRIFTILLSVVFLLLPVFLLQLGAERLLTPVLAVVSGNFVLAGQSGMIYLIVYAIALAAITRYMRHRYCS